LAMSYFKFVIHQKIKKNMSARNTIYELFHKKSFDYHVDPRKLFYMEFKKIPSTILDRNIDVQKLYAYLKTKFKSNLIDCIAVEREAVDASGTYTIDEAYFILNENIMLYLNNAYTFVNLFFTATSENYASEIRKDINRFKIEEKEKEFPEIEVIINKGSRITTETKQLNAINLSVEENYNDDFLEEHQTIIERLTTENDKGIILLHGEPGTGKTTYIKYLSGILKKQIIFMPPNLAASITSPRLMELMLDYSNSILIIEDAEHIIQDRDRNGNSPISALLNLSDGLLSDCLNIQIICTFNTDLSNVDKALMRKGRLISKYEFKALSIEKANLLSKKLGFEADFDSPQVLSDIYNQKEKTREVVEKKRIGFSN